MIKTARQLKDLIRNLSREKSADAQILMRNYMMERFLERISLSEYHDKFIFRGVCVFFPERTACKSSNPYPSPRLSIRAAFSQPGSFKRYDFPRFDTS